jgi:hypothetical protein
MSKGSISKKKNSTPEKGIRNNEKEEELIGMRTRTEMVFETLVFSPLNHLTLLIARENFIILSRRESNKSH